MLLLLLVLFGLLQAALLLGGRDILHHASARAARARTVGFNDWMALKAARVAAIPVSGRMLTEQMGYDPGLDGSSGEFEVARIPQYLEAEYDVRADYILDYEEWENGHLHFGERPSLLGGGVLHYDAVHEMPLKMPLAPVVFPWATLDGEGIPRIRMESHAAAGEHSSLYLE